MAKKPVSSKRVPKPAKANRGATRPAVKKTNKPLSGRALVKKPTAARNGQGGLSAAGSYPRKSRPAWEASVRQLDRQILQLVNRRAEATTRLIESAPNRNAAVYDL